MSFQSVQLKTILSASVFILAWILLAVQSVGQPANSPSIEQRVVAKIQQSGKGVILGIAAHGEDATALTDKLLTEVESNRYYAPVFITSEGLGF
jgi:20S proteasome alpha/beta subunit